MSPASSSPAIAPGRVAGGPSARAYAIGRLLEESGWWLILVTLVLLAAGPAGAAGQVGLVLVAWLVLRPVLIAVGPGLPGGPAYGAGALTIAAAVAFALAGVINDTALLLVAAVALGGLRAFALGRRPIVAAQLFGAAAHRVADPEARAGWLGLATGGALAAVAFPFVPVLGLVGALLVVTGMVVSRTLLADVRVAHVGVVPAAAAPTDANQAAAGRPAFQPLVRSRLTTHLAAALAVGTLFAAVVAFLPQLAATTGGATHLAGFGLALVGVGGAILRAPRARSLMLRLRQRVPPTLLVATVVGAVAVTVALVALLGGWLAALLLPGVGLLAALLREEHVLRLRQVPRGDRSALAALLLAASVGQLAGALVVAVLGGEPTLAGSVAVLLAIGAAVLMAVALLIDRSSLAALRAQVQQFSWNADPSPRAYEPAQAATRRARLEGWIGRQVELELVDVTLPVSGRRYAIARPSGDGRDSLFEQAKADPERQMPYWAKVWPSGVALADLVVERADEVRGRQVLELGAGLGVTACAVLEEGGRVITADYSLLPLALCRLNGLANSGRPPGSICFNWRDEAQVREVLRRHPAIGLILAADVLYEGRDVMPLVHVIERLLAPDGSLWLAEPVRRTAYRFLDTVAATGWTIDSRRIRSDWPDATNGWVNVHIIQRERAPSAAALGLGGFQL